MPTPRIDLVDLEVDSVDFVDQGDNPEAHIVMHKRAGHAGEGKEQMSELLKTRSGVVALATKAAEDVQARNPGMSLPAARAAVWKSHPELRGAFDAATADEPVPVAPVVKGADALTKHAGVAAELRKADPQLSEAAAKVRAWELRPDLAAEYRQA